MNIPHKFLVNNCFSDEKFKFYEKLPNRYNKIITEFVKKKSNNEKYYNKVINWLFSQDEEKRMILCSVENKKHTNTIYDAYVYYSDNGDDAKFKLSDIDSPDSEKFKLEFNVNFKKIFDKNIEKKEDSSNAHNKFLTYLLFYQCETPINDFNNYSSYFTLSPEILQNETFFKKECNEISNNKFLSNPIEIHRNPKIKNNLTFDLPKWIQDNKINQNYPYDTDENNFPNYFTLAQYALALIEQVLSIRYILYNENKNLEEILSSTYLNTLFDKKKCILKYLNTINLDSSMFYKVFIEEAERKIFMEDDLKNFIEEKKKGINKSVNNKNVHYYINEETESTYKNIAYVYEKLVEKNKNDKNKFNLEVVNNRMFIQINILFTIDDFFFRAIFEQFYNEYLNQICEDLIINKEKKPKKKNRKKKKNNQINEQKNEMNNSINKDKSEIFNFLKKLIMECLEEKLNKINEIHINMNITNDKKEKTTIKKQKEFFLYKTNKKDKNKKKINNNKINNINKNDKSNNKAKGEGKNNEIETNSNIATSYTNNNSFFINISKNINISNNILIKLNEDINNFNRDIESFLIVFRKIKKEVKNHFEKIIKNIYDNDSKLEIYGSSLYQLDIESSDLDLSIITKSELSLEELFIYISNNNSNNQYIDIKYINTASIPVIKLKVEFLKLNDDKINENYNMLINNNYYKICINNNIYNEFNIIKIDISLKSIIYKQISFIQNGIKDYPYIKPLIKILKKLLVFKNMNNSYKGGMSSYCLFLIIYSYLKINQNINKESNKYGALLLGFLYHYINYVDFSYTIIKPNLDNPFLISSFPIEVIPTIIDPATMNNAGKIIFRIIDVVSAFNEIYKDILLIIKDDKNDGNIIYKLFNKYVESK